jgi:hypothetical protein
MPLKHASSTDYTPDILAFTSIAFALSTIALCARIWARTLIKSGVGVDDLLALVGWVSSFYIPRSRAMGFYGDGNSLTGGCFSLACLLMPSRII